MTIRCVIQGSGGHARVVIDTLRDLGGVEIVGALDSDTTRWHQEIDGVPILGGDECLPTVLAQGVGFFVVGVGGTHDNRPRERLFRLGQSFGLVPMTIRHRTAICSTRVQQGRGLQLLAGSIVNAGAILGDNVIVNSGAIVEHDCRIGDHVHIATGARLAGSVRVAEGAHVGIGATIRQGVVIGARAVVGAGAVVVKDVEADTVVAGVPARVLRRRSAAA